jgi:hypothetical protein
MEKFLQALLLAAASTGAKISLPRGIIKIADTIALPSVKEWNPGDSIDSVQSRIYEAMVLALDGGLTQYEHAAAIQMCNELVVQWENRKMILRDMAAARSPIEVIDALDAINASRVEEDMNELRTIIPEPSAEIDDAIGAGSKAEQFRREHGFIK